MLAIRKSPIKAKTSDSTALDVRYVQRDIAEIPAHEHILALMDFGSTQLHANHFGIPLDALSSDCVATAWISDQIPTISHASKSASLVQTDHLIFGSIRIPADNIEQSTKQAYRSIQNAINQNPGFHLIRLWNFFPAINAEDHGMERYRLFSRARHEVLASSGYRMTTDLPAASAVGSKEGPLVIHFLAGNGDISSLENPRQVSAYHYPRSYGPRSPSFSRAVIHQTHLGQQFFISGTASIVGHETIAPSDPEVQTQVTIDNISALLEAAHYPTLKALGREASWVVYVRDPLHINLIRPFINEKIHPESNIVYLQGDICRKDLMVEIEGTIFRSP